VESSASNLSPLDSVMRLLVALEGGSVGTKGALKSHSDDQVSESIQNKMSIQFQSSIQKQHTFTWDLKPLL